MIPRLGEPVVRDVAYVHRPGVYAILRRGQEVLLTFQSAPEAEFQLPGGGIDPGEQPLAALHREVFEETGWSISRGRRLGAFRRFVWMPDYEKWGEKVCAIYSARPILCLGPPREAGHSAVWVDIRDAPLLAGNAGDRAFLDRYLQAEG